LTKPSLYVYFGPVAVLVCRRFDLSPFGPVAVSTYPKLIIIWRHVMCI